MKVIYIADDGSMFDDEYACKDHEWKLDHPHLKEIHVFNEDGVELTDILSEDTYNHSARIVINSPEALKDLQDLADYTGYCAYEWIDKVGEWKFNAQIELFEHVEAVKF